MPPRRGALRNVTQALPYHEWSRQTADTPSVITKEDLYGIALQRNHASSSIIIISKSRRVRLLIYLNYNAHSISPWKWCFKIASRLDRFKVDDYNFNAVFKVRMILELT